MIESIGPHLSKDTSDAYQNLLNILNAKTPEEGAPWIHDFNRLFLPQDVKSLVTQLQNANHWGHLPEMKRLAKKILPYFS